MMSRVLLPYWTQWLFNGAYTDTFIINIFRDTTFYTMLGIILFTTAIYVIIIVYLLIMVSVMTIRFGFDIIAIISFIENSLYTNDIVYG